MFKQLPDSEGVDLELKEKMSHAILEKVMKFEELVIM